MLLLNLILSNRRIFNDTNLSLQAKYLYPSKWVKLKPEFVQFESNVVYQITIVYKRGSASTDRVMSLYWLSFGAESVLSFTPL